MHNRARLVAASFLVKDLLLPWQTGAAWFWDTLVDADLANNTLGWQWVAGSGADAAPYFRILNPVAQGRRFDPDGDYVRRFVPELGRLPGAWLHAPWQAPTDELERAGVRLGETYPLPIVDHGEARRRALAAFDVVERLGAKLAERDDARLGPPAHDLDEGGRPRQREARSARRARVEEERLCRATRSPACGCGR